MTRPPPRSTLFPYTTLFRSYTIAKRRKVDGYHQQPVIQILAEGPRFDHGREFPMGGRHDSHVKAGTFRERSEEHTSELQSLTNLVCRLLLEKKKKKTKNQNY